MLYFVRAYVTQPDKMTHKELYMLWNKEAEAALQAKKTGAIKELYKVAGLRQVAAILDMPSNHDLDKAIARLPFNKETGLLDLEILPIYPYEEFAEDMKRSI